NRPGAFAFSRAEEIFPAAQSRGAAGSDGAHARSGRARSVETSQPRDALRPGRQFDRTARTTRMIQFPFIAIVGMEHAKRSLIYHAIDLRIGGTLFLGHRGCAKSTLVRSFADLLQSTSNGTAPFVEVPLGTTEDRLLGSVNAEALVEQSK